MDGDLPDLLPYMIVSESGAHGFVELFPGGWALSELALYFAGSHVLACWFDTTQAGGRT